MSFDKNVFQSTLELGLKELELEELLPSLPAFLILQNK